jgi:hypothetical protein
VRPLGQIEPLQLLEVREMHTARSGFPQQGLPLQITTVNFYDFASRRSKVVRPLTGTPAALGGLGITVCPDERWLIYTRSADWQGDVILISTR